MRLPPAVMVHSHEMARQALACRRPVTLLSAPDAASFAGVGWWQALIGLVRAEFAEAEMFDVLDCGDAPGRALEALRAGQSALVLEAGPEVFADVAARAAALDALVLPVAPVSLDLADAGAARRLADWLAPRDGVGAG